MTDESLKSWIRFADVFNDTKAYPTLAHVAVELGLSYQTVRNKAAIARRMSAESASFPKIVNRSSRPEKAVSDDLSAEEHAQIRANTLSTDIHELITDTGYPVTNPGAVLVESHTQRIYDRASGDYVEVEGTPRTWLSDTLRVAPLARVANRRFIFTGAQNDAPVHKGFWKNLSAYAAKIGAQIVVGPWTYETSWWSETNPLSRTYDPLIQKHLCFGQMALGDNFVFCGEMNTLPTASRPISDLLTYSRGRWAVFPHAKLQLKSVPSTDPSRQAHQVMTTGAVTLPKVVPRKAGVKSIFHHVIGATLVEFDAKGHVFCRQLNAADDGSFYDLDTLVSEGKITKGHRLRGMVCPDVHRRKLSRKNCKAVFGYDLETGGYATGSSMFELLDPEVVFLHDLLDFEARSHHNAGDNAYSYEMAYRGCDKVMEEVEQAADFLTRIETPSKSRIKVVESNHDLALERWVREGRYRNDGANVRYGLQLENAYLAWREKVGDALNKDTQPPSFSMFEYAARQAKPNELKNVEWIYDSQSFLLDGIECGHHGFRGANGAKGTITGFAAMGRKMSIGDKHSPEILDGVYCAGVMQLNHGYNKGPSGWATAVILHYPNGKRALVTLQDGKWRA